MNESDKSFWIITIIVVIILGAMYLHVSSYSWYPMHLRYKGTKPYQEIASEFWNENKLKKEVDFESFNKPNILKAILGIYEEKSDISINEVKKRLISYNIRQAKTAWKKAKSESRKGWSISEYLKSANYSAQFVFYLKTGKVAPQKARAMINMTDENVGIALFDYHITNVKNTFKILKGDKNNVYYMIEAALSPTNVTDHLKNLKKVGISLNQLGINLN